MDDKKLILLVKERNELYNKQNPLFKAIDYKRNAWEEVANEMGLSAGVCLRRWTSLRDRYTRELKKSEEDIMDDDGNIYVWPYFEMMDFLRPHITTRPNRRSIPLIPQTLKIRKRSAPSSPESVSSPPSSPEPVQSQKSPSPAPASSREPSPAPQPPQQVNYQEFPKVFEDPLIDSSFLRKRSKIQPNPEVDKRFCEAIETLKKACTENEARNSNPAVYAFGEMIVSTICKMNSRNQIKTMQQVTDLVMRIKLEEDELMHQQVTYPMI